jgi:hypothetical protein
MFLPFLASVLASMEKFLLSLIQNLGLNSEARYNLHLLL